MASAGITSRGRRLGFTFGIPVVGIAWAAFQLGRLWDDGATAKYPWWALAIGSLSALVLFGVLELAVTALASPTRKRYGWLAVVLGADGRLSTSKAQAMMWTVTLGIAIVYFGAIEALGPDLTKTPFDNADWEQYLVLLGGPFAAAVLAKLAVVTKLQAGTIQRTVTEAASGDATTLANVSPATATPAEQAAADRMAVSDQPAKAADLVSNDKDEVDLADTQYLFFNVAAFLYFFVVFVSGVFGSTDPDRFALPAMPDVILGLTSLSAATYLGNKAAQKDPPRIAAVVPAGPAGGEEVTVLGTNLVPAGLVGSAAAATSVLVEKAIANAQPADSTVLAVAADPTSSSVKFTMPDAFQGSDVLVRVMTAASVVTPPYPLKVKP